MDIVDLLNAFANPETLKHLSASQKMTASLITTLLGMGITFVALVSLQLVIMLMARLNAISSAAPAPEKRQEEAAAVSPPSLSGGISEAEVAAITASLALMLDTSTSGLVIRNIRKIEDTTPAWSRAGMVEQLHNNV